jgi:hypothetical protein
MLLCDVASLIRLSIRFCAANSRLGTAEGVKFPGEWRLDYNIAPRSTKTEESPFLQR